MSLSFCLAPLCKVSEKKACTFSIFFFFQTLDIVNEHSSSFPHTAQKKRKIKTKFLIEESSQLILLFPLIFFPLLLVCVLNITIVVTLSSN